MAIYKKGNMRGEKLLIEGPAGKLQLQISYPQDFQPTHPLVIISHPHPLYGGNMSSKVVYNIARAFNHMGYAALRYNFRGVDQSEGEFDQGTGEVEDLTAVFEFITQRHPQSAIALAGFSFGAYVTARALTAKVPQTLSPAAVLLVAPPVNLYDFSDRAVAESVTKPVPWMVIQGGKDEIVDPEQVATWVETQSDSPAFYCLQQADHFFQGQMDGLREMIISHWV